MRVTTSFLCLVVLGGVFRNVSGQWAPFDKLMRRFNPLSERYTSSSCQEGTCKAAIYCLHGERRLKEPCTLSNGAQGVCCGTYPERNELSASISDRCQPPPRCNAGQSNYYRSADGSCNSQNDPRLGTANTPFLRLMPAAYVDNQWSPVRQPPARQVSATVFAEGDQPHPTLAQTTPYWGQFITHDLTLAPPATLQNGSDIGCCSPDGRNIAQVSSEAEPQCAMPVQVPASDPFYRSANVRCLNFVRTGIAPSNCFTYGADAGNVAHQLNEATHYLDGSMIYGSSNEALRGFRSFQGGRLRSLRENGRDMLPLGSENDCAPNSGGCFVAGDPRVNQVIGLAAMHLLMLREHNRIAGELSSRHPDWNDETLFQEARALVIAEIQHITYFEWLPEIVGPNIMNLLNKYNQGNGGLNPVTEMYNPAISSEFATAAFRYGHSTIDGRMNLPSANSNSQNTENLRISDFFFRSGRLRERGFFNRLLRWMTETPMQEADRFVTTELRGLLDKTVRMPGNQLGFDLAAFNIQRGRDFGVRRYIDYRYWLGMHQVQSWSDLDDVMDGDMINLLSRAYANPGDVDLYVGGLVERHAPGAAVGPTFQAIIMEQFSRTLLGDPSFYLHSGKWKTSQLREIRKASFARIVCDNSDNIGAVPLNAFKLPNGNGNPRRRCNEIPAVNLAAWG